MPGPWEVILVFWAWKPSLLASSASKTVGEGLGGEKAPALPLSIWRRGYEGRGQVFQVVLQTLGGQFLP